MFMNKLATALLLAVASSVASVAAGDVHVARATWNPKILSPNTQTVWVRGHMYSVTWDASNPLASVTNPNGTLTLGKTGQQGVVTLSGGFPLADGSVQITVPSNIDAGTDYIITLYGDSGNTSDDFTIQ
ncbi:hypothetical protein EVJ58_g10949 [Rhodofomes roseus]|nr:hypothetical protein EVJ58_g10949 [Rhodofomes roseus]